MTMLNTHQASQKPAKGSLPESPEDALRLVAQPSECDDQTLDTAGSGGWNALDSVIRTILFVREHPSRSRR